MYTCTVHVYCTISSRVFMYMYMHRYIHVVLWCMYILYNVHVYTVLCTYIMHVKVRGQFSVDELKGNNFH